LRETTNKSTVRVGSRGSGSTLISSGSLKIKGHARENGIVEDSSLELKRDWRDTHARQTRAERNCAGLMGAELSETNSGGADSGFLPSR
jgi:hypothetical protein